MPRSTVTATTGGRLRSWHPSLTTSTLVQQSLAHPRVPVMRPNSKVRAAALRRPIWQGEGRATGRAALRFGCSIPGKIRPIATLQHEWIRCIGKTATQARRGGMSGIDTSGETSISDLKLADHSPWRLSAAPMMDWSYALRMRVVVRHLDDTLAAVALSLHGSTL
jgi:hypothetical protein